MNFPKVLLYTFCIFLFSSTSLFSQGLIYDDFSLKTMPGWLWGGVEMKYSHNEDNKENGFAEIIYDKTVKPNSYIGKIERHEKFLVTAGNYFNVMMKGIDNDVTVKVSLIYDVDNDNNYTEAEDILLVTEPVSLNFNGWKELRFKVDEENFKIVSKHKEDDFTVTEEQAMGVRIEFESGPKYKLSSFESGIALISEIENKENLTSERMGGLKNSEDSYFKARNYPNPFNPTTSISFTLLNDTHVDLAVYDRLGREVKVLINENKSAGTHSVEFTAEGLPSGIYFYRIKTPERTEVMKMIMAK